MDFFFALLVLLVCGKTADEQIENTITQIRGKMNSLLFFTVISPFLGRRVWPDRCRRLL